MSQLRGYQSIRIVLGSILFLILISSPNLLALERLGHDVEPIKQQIFLRMDADDSLYTGSVMIELEVRKVTNKFELYAERMDLNEVRLEGPNGDVGLSYEFGISGRLNITTDTELQTGDYKLHVSFTDNYDLRAAGMYKVSIEGEHYIYTQFESDDAREAFPCWDEPEFKIPFQFIISVPEHDEIITNDPVLEESIADGWKTVVFQESKPMPSYLLALASGPLEMVDVPNMDIPTRVVTVKGKSHLCGTALEITAPLMKALEEYFGQPYPYKKLDLIAAPEYWWGAMENPGAIVYLESILVFDPKTASKSQIRRQAGTTAHELAHMWFGDLVTMEWWDDIWLNESFATWSGNKIVDQVFPEYSNRVRSTGGKNYAMTVDSRTSTRPVRQSIGPDENFERLFDALAYQKGQAVLEMVEAWIGPEKFRDGVVDYIKKNEWGNATCDDFFAALSGKADIDIGELMAPYLFKGGVPLVGFEQTDDHTVKLTRSRFTNIGDEYEEKRTWPVLMQLRYSDGAQVYTTQVLLDQDEMSVDLPAEGKVLWIVPNAEATGYYRWNLPPEMLIEMAAQSGEILSTVERVHFLHNLSALFDAGMLDGGKYLTILSEFTQDPDPQVLSSAIGGLGRMYELFIRENNADAYAPVMRKLLMPALDRIGLDVAEGETPAVTDLRTTLLGWLSDEGQELNLRNHMQQMAQSYVETGDKKDPQTLSTAIAISARYGDAALFAQYQKLFEDAKMPADRRMYLSSLGRFRSDSLIKVALEYSLTDAMRPQELLRIPWGISNNPEYEEFMFNWVLENYDTLCDGMPSRFQTGLVGFAGGRSMERVERAHEFFMDSTRFVSGITERLAQVKADVKLRLTLIERNKATVLHCVDKMCREASE